MSQFLLFKYKDSQFIPDLDVIQCFSAFHTLWSATRTGPSDKNGVNKYYNMLDLRLVSYMAETSRKVNKFAALPIQERWVAVKADIKYDMDAPEESKRINDAINQYVEICNKYYPINRNLNALEISLSENSIFFENLNSINKQLSEQVAELREQIKKVSALDSMQFWQSINMLNGMINENMTKSVDYANKLDKAIKVINTLKNDADNEREKEIVLVGNKRKGNREDPK